jgi:ankyrin repeat protein
MLMKLKITFIYLLIFAFPVYSADANSLFSAAMLGKTERVKSILSQGVDVNEKSTTGRTALMAACFNGNLRVVRILLAYGANVNLADNLGSTALMEAVTFGNEKLLNLLITAGADTTAIDKQNMSVLDKAKTTKHTHIVKSLEKLATDNKNEKEEEPENAKTEDKK